MYKEKKIVALILARAGSKGIKNKNILSLKGIPLIAYSINYAKKSKLIDRIFVSTDGYKIAKISKKFGAEVINRPKKISKDTSTSNEAISHAIKFLIEKLKIDFDIVVFLQPTTPLRKNGEIDEAINLLIKKKMDTVFSSNNYLPFIWKKIKKNFLPANFDLGKRKRRQELCTVNETGSFYIFTKKSFLRSKNIFGKKIVNFDSEFLSSILEVDNIQDYYYISNLLKTNIPKKYNIFLP